MHTYSDSQEQAACQVDLVDGYLWKTQTFCEELAVVIVRFKITRF
jgi:hypothetical protein